MATRLTALPITKRTKSKNNSSPKKHSKPHPLRKGPKPIEKGVPSTAPTSPKIPYKHTNPRKGSPTIGMKTAGERQKERALVYNNARNKLVRDIAPINFDAIDWKRRNKCKENLRLFAETYLPSVFYLGWSNDQLKCIKRVEEVFTVGGMFALAMPRGGGKTAICRAGTLWGTAYGFRNFPFLIGSSADKSTQTLEFIKMYWYQSSLLQQDFPEIAYPILKLDNRGHSSKGQIYKGRHTHIEWEADSIRYPCILLDEEDVKGYLKHDKDSVVEVPKEKHVHLLSDGQIDYNKSMRLWIPRSAGTIIRTSGIDGSIRGDAEVHPITLEQPRPDVILLDDIQKDQKAESPIQCEKLINIVDGCVQGLFGPGKRISCLMPCTVIREGDASDTYLDRMKKPEWRGERCQMIMSWPPGITDNDITLDTEAGKLWNKYDELRKLSLREHGDIRLATQLYKENRLAMEEGFVASWPERYDKHKELSAQQHAMNLRFTNPLTFPAEFQNKGRKALSTGSVPITADQLAEKTINLPQRIVPQDTQYLTAFIDVQNEVLFYVVLATAPDFTAVITDYGTFPNVSSRLFHKFNTESWSLLSKQFFRTYPNQANQAWTTSDGKHRAPLEAKIYHSLTMAVKTLLSLEFIKDDGFGTSLRLNKVGIDTRWGQVTDVIRRFCREYGTKRLKLPMADGEVEEIAPRNNILVPYFGQAVNPLHKQYEEYTRTKGWLFEDQISPQVKEVKWIYKPDQSGQYQLLADVNRLKTFVMSRFASAPGTPGCFSLYDAIPQHHEMFTHHICNSEYPELVMARGAEKEMWLEREGRPDNDFLDCVVGCTALASMLGAFLRTEASRGTVNAARRERKLSKLWQKKRRG